MRHFNCLLGTWSNVLDLQRNFFPLSFAEAHSELQPMLLTRMSITILFHGSLWFSLSQSFATAVPEQDKLCSLSPGTTVLRRVKKRYSP